jgi:hypothetical protein
MTTVIRLFGYNNSQAGIGTQFALGEFDDLTYITEEYANIKENKKDTRIGIVSFKLSRGYGVTFYKEKYLRNSSRTFYAPRADVHRAFVGVNSYDRSVDGMKFDRSSNTMIHNIRSMKVFVLPTQDNCKKADVAERDLCQKVWGETAVETAGDEYRMGTPSGPASMFPGGVMVVASDPGSNFVIQPSGLSDAEAQDWLDKHSGLSDSMFGDNGLYILIFVVAIILVVLYSGGSQPSLIPGMNPITQMQGMFNPATGQWVM